MAYATVDDLAGYVTTVPATANILLERCSRDVDDALLTAVYDPTLTTIQDALRRATCEQAAEYIATGRPTGVGPTVAGFSIGSVSVTRGSGGNAGGGAQTGVLCRRAWQILQQVQLTGMRPWAW
jgi:hypothetical protein